MVDGWEVPLTIRTCARARGACIRQCGAAAELGRALPSIDRQSFWGSVYTRGDPCITRYRVYTGAARVLHGARVYTVDTRAVHDVQTFT
jgi:hypothetical protein